MSTSRSTKNIKEKEKDVKEDEEKKESLVRNNKS